MVSVLGNIYVWHGRGSRSNEASHASSYASSLSNDTVPILEFKEGEEDPMFWAYLGDEPWANADYWSERSEHEGRPSSSVWKIDASTSSPVRHATYSVFGLFSPRTGFHLTCVSVRAGRVEREQYLPKRSVCR